MHGLGNDFVVFDARAEPLALSAARVIALADRHTGIGCDQLVVIEASEVASAFMRIWNGDGREVEACGNAARCVATLLGGEGTIATVGGILDATATAGGASVTYPPPRFDWEAIPLAYPVDTADLPVAWPLPNSAAGSGAAGDGAAGDGAAGSSALEHGFAVNVGNPHVVFFVADSLAVPLGEIGPAIEADALFPAHVNVGVAHVIDRNRVALRVWERGAGLTRACGTGAIACAVAAIRRGLAASPVTVGLPGGDLVVEWTGGPVTLRGPAATSFTGVVEL